MTIQSKQHPSSAGAPQRINETLREIIAQEIARLSNATSLITVVGVVYLPAKKEVRAAVSVYPEHKTPEALAFLRRHARGIARVAARAIRERNVRVVFPAPPAKAD
ncbi:hypothetical protein D6792_04025 [Candidatus Parcubacteria bacterium]|nr:MAG: hypothetical protein D6792_04025 [Candidatus Parcubacteria bacterium]GIW69112.1 MAG: hypothetical protein KatS3mg100_606 [Candidatus Parcubacteria bacterium]